MNKQKKLIIPINQHQNVVLMFQQIEPNGNWICQTSNEYMLDLTKMLNSQVEDATIKV